MSSHPPLPVSCAFPNTEHFQPVAVCALNQHVKTPTSVRARALRAVPCMLKTLFVRVGYLQDVQVTQRVCVCSTLVCKRGTTQGSKFLLCLPDYLSLTLLIPARGRPPLSYLLWLSMTGRGILAAWPPHSTFHTEL